MARRHAEEQHSEPRPDASADAPARRGGAHRRSSGGIQQGAAAALVVILALAAVLLIVGTVNIVRSANSDPEAQVAEVKGDGATGGEGKDEADSGASASPSPSESAVGTVPAKSSDPKIGVLNASGVKGAARTLANKYKAEGWTLGRVANARATQAQTVVYYADSEDRSAARRVAKGLGGVEVEQSSRYRSGITVVLGEDIASSFAREN